MNRATAIAATALLLSIGTAQAMPPSEFAYANELERCVSLLRDTVSDQQTVKLRYTVTKVKSRGAWYEFAIRSEVYHELDGPSVRRAEHQCRAHRWDETTEFVS